MFVPLSHKSYWTDLDELYSNILAENTKATIYVNIPYNFVII